MVKQKDNFYTKSQVYFDNDLMKIIYHSDEFCVCNVANHCYVIFDYNEVNGLQFGFLASPKMIKMVIESPSALYEMFSGMSSKELSDYILELNERTFGVLQKYKLNHDINGPSKMIDYHFEEELMKLNNKGKSK